MMMAIVATASLVKEVVLRLDEVVCKDDNELTIANSGRTSCKLEREKIYRVAIASSWKRALYASSVAI